VELLTNPIRSYAWGSRTELARLQGRAVPSPTPEAELWMGAHPVAPSTVERPGGSVSLADLISAAPRETLGEAVVATFGARLPYLLKVLAAESPLSLQAHPDAERARRVYHAQRAAGGPATYADPFHKPELLVALTPFEALCGFRDPRVSAELLAGLGVPALAPLVAALREGPAGLRTAAEALLTWPAADRAPLVDAVVGAATAAARDDPAGAEGGFATEYALAGRLAAYYPGDVGVVVALLLNHVVLAPGEAVWMPPGNLHSYLHGTGVEIMAASDNVVRGGLTPKPVDVPELLQVVRFEPLDKPVVPPTRLGAGVVTWTLPVIDFGLFQVEADGGEVAVPVRGPCTVFCRSGALTVDDGRAAVRLSAGAAAFGGAGAGPVRFRGAGTAFLATTNL